MSGIGKRISQGLNNTICRMKPTAPPNTNKKSSYFSRARIVFAIPIVMVSALLINQINFIVIDKGDNLFITSLNGYESHVSLPNCSLYFNDEEISTITSGLACKQVPLCSEADIIQQFGFDPLKNLWLPSGLKSCFNTKTNPKWDDDYIMLLNPNKLYWLSSIYREDPDANTKTPYDINTSKTIVICLSHKTPMSSDLETAGDEIISRIHDTDVEILHASPGSNTNFPNAEFTAKFTYKDVGYTIYASNGVSQVEFINVLTSIIRS